MFGFELKNTRIKLLLRVLGLDSLVSQIIELSNNFVGDGFASFSPHDRENVGASLLALENFFYQVLTLFLVSDFKYEVLIPINLLIKSLNLIKDSSTLLNSDHLHVLDHFKSLLVAQLKVSFN